MMISKNLVDGLVLESKAKPDPICEPCLAGKMHANLSILLVIHHMEVISIGLHLLMIVLARKWLYQ